MESDELVKHFLLAFVLALICYVPAHPRLTQAPRLAIQVQALRGLCLTPGTASARLLRAE